MMITLAAIELPGGSAGPTPEAWERVEGTPTSTPVGSGREPELIVRNICQPAILPSLPDRPTGSAMIVVPGGGFLSSTIEREGHSVAKWLNERGIASFILKHRLAPTPADTRQASRELRKAADDSMARIRQGGTTLTELLSQEQVKSMYAARDDGLEAVRHVRSHAAEWGLSPGRIGIMGFSSGAITAIQVVLGARADTQPDLVVLLYGMPPDNAAIPSTAPAAFIAVAADDGAVSGSLAIHDAWRKAGVPAELHVIESGGHGFAVLRQGKSSDHWVDILDRWLAAHGFAREAPQPAPS
jgi:acetyl esterase/lipase